MLLLEYEFIVVYKHGKTHVVVNVISMLLNSLEPLGHVLDQTMDASLFSIESIWMQEMKTYLKMGRCQKLWT